MFYILYLESSLTDKAMSEQSVTKKVFSAARDGRAITIFALLCQRSQCEIDKILCSVTEEDDQYTTPFLIAARNGHSTVIRLLLSHYGVDIEQIGTVKFDGFVIEGATALWCAAGAGHFDVVQTLIEFQADVNHATFSNSTPLRAACFDGRLDIVKFLLDQNADLHIANKYNNTCLMIAAYKGHTDVVSHLLQKGARANVVATCGATALHFAAERGHLDVVRHLMSYGAEILRNDQNMTALDIAAESGHANVVEYFITHSDCSKITRIEALELLGASYANDKDNYNILKCYHYLWLAMYERFSDPHNALPKTVLPPIEAYENRIESQSLAELELMKNNADALHMEALIVRERILGIDNPEIPHPIVFRGAVFADMGQFDRCIMLWMRVLKLRQHNKRPISKDLLRFAQVFAQMVFLKLDVPFDGVEEVFHFLLTEIDRDGQMMENRNGTKEEHVLAEEMLEANIHTALYLLAILLQIKNTDDEDFRICKLAYALNRKELLLRTNKRSLLHLVCDEATSVDDFHVSDVVIFPDDSLVRLLLKCGADVNALDVNGNTALHVIVQFSHPISHFMTLHNIIVSLVDAGVHVDCANKQRQTARDVSTTGVAEVILWTKFSLSLKCIAARAVRKHNIAFHNVVPVSLEEFIAMH